MFMVRVRVRVMVRVRVRVRGSTVRITVGANIYGQGHIHRRDLCRTAPLDARWGGGG